MTGEVSVKVISLVGRVMIDRTEVLDANGSLSLNIEELPHGIFFIRLVNSDNEILEAKFSRIN